MEFMIVRVWQHRFIRGSDQNDRPNIVWEGISRKDARGQAKSNLMSHLNVMMEHEHYPDAAVNIEIDKELEVFSAQYYDDDGLVYSIDYKIEVS